MQRLAKFNIGMLFALILATYLAYYLLLQDNCLHTSIGFILSHSHGLALKEHLIVLGLLPIYIAMIIFGAGLLAAYLGSTLQDFFVPSLSNTSTKTVSCENNHRLCK